MYYARIASWPSSTAFALMVIFYVANATTGVLLILYTFRARDTCRITAPLLYRWCFAAGLFTALLLGLCAIVPLVRCAARCICAPVALCLISCVETVGMDVDVGLVGGPMSAGGLGGGGGSGSGSGLGDGGSSGARKIKEQFIPAAAMVIGTVLCAPFFIVYKVLCAPICRPLSVCFFKCFECLGCVQILPDGRLQFVNCCGEVTCGFIVRHMTQCLLAPGMTLPGRSIVGAFTNYSALVWFWCYLLFECYWNWNLMCDSAVPDATDDLSSWGSWFGVLAPSPVHWLILLFAVAGLTFTLVKFIADMFSTPNPPPRSAYEVHKIKMKRQVRVCINLVLFSLFCVWGGFLTYFTETQSQCASSSPSIWRLALMLRFAAFCVFFLALGLAACVCVECCLSGRMRLVLLLADDPLYGYGSYTGDAATSASIHAASAGVLPAAGDGYRHPEESTKFAAVAPDPAGRPGTTGAPRARTDGKYFVGAIPDQRSRLVSESPELGGMSTSYTNADPSQYRTPLLPEQAV